MKLSVSAKARLHDHIAQMTFQIGVAKGRQILEVGTGHGAFRGRLAAYGYSKPFDIDIAAPVRPTLLYELRKHDSSVGQTLVADDQFMLIVNSKFVDKVENTEALPKKISKVFAPGGTLIMAFLDASRSRRRWISCGQASPKVVCRARRVAMKSIQGRN